MQMRRSEITCARTSQKEKRQEYFRREPDIVEVDLQNLIEFDISVINQQLTLNQHLSAYLLDAYVCYLS